MRAAIAALALFLTFGVHAAQWSVAVIGPDNDPRVLAVKEAVAHWNDELAELGASMRFGPVTRSDGPRPDEDTLRAISDNTISSSWFGGGMPDLHPYHADVVIFLATSDLISVGFAPHRNRPGMIILREADDPPLSMSNVARNVVAHELGHVLGLSHNDDRALLMCGRPASCRPFVYRSPELRWFPLSDEEKAYLKRRFS
jgi:hypothetical protein